MTLRFHIWAIGSDVCNTLGLPFSWYLRCVEGMSKATDWGDGS